MADQSPHAPLAITAVKEWDDAALQRLSDTVHEVIDAEALAVRTMLSAPAGPMVDEGTARALVAALSDAQLLQLPGQRIQLGDEIAQLQAAIAAVRQLHQPVGMYDECDCEDPTTPGHVEVDEIGMTCHLTHLVCRACCITSDDVQSEDCADHHAHTTGTPLCLTIAALVGVKGGVA